MTWKCIVSAPSLFSIYSPNYPHRRSSVISFRDPIAGCKYCVLTSGVTCHGIAPVLSLDVSSPILARDERTLIDREMMEIVCFCGLRVHTNETGKICFQ